ncbi:hypothetical protein ACH42_04610 [Endozoicomonas sp. (ex Bugula neritina AB1)]|nr:hypothetical protein ACH42_04610 [Endozoicomonas sp. (ex Bugula neritina AB1)]
MKKALLFALAIPLSHSTLAASLYTAEDDGPKWYQADMVVFRYRAADTEEAWPPVIQQVLPANVISLKDNMPEKVEPLSGNILEPSDPSSIPVPPDLAREPFVSLPRSDFLLNKELGNLKRSNRYEVISQVAWRMPVDEHIQEQPVKITATSKEGDQFLLSGTVTVSASRYLHVEADLWFNELATEALYSEISGQELNADFSEVAEKGSQRGPIIRLNPEDAPLRITRNFQLSEKRRIKHSDEIQYLDSPVIGVLFKLTPYTPPSILEISKESNGKTPELKVTALHSMPQLFDHQ